MGPSTNQPQQPTSDRGSKLPVPDVDSVAHVVVAREEPASGVKKWLFASLISVGALALAGIVIFAVYAYMTSTPKYMLSAAMTNLVASEGQAGDFSYANTNTKLNGDFLSFSDPTNDKSTFMTVALGSGASRVSAHLRLFADGNDVQFVGLGNTSRLLESVGLGKSVLSDDSIVRLANLDGQWYSQTPNDLWQLKPVTSQHTLQGTANSTLVETTGQLYAKYPFITIAQQYPDEPIDSVTTMHLRLGIDSAKLNEYLRALKSAQSSTIMLTDADIAAITNGDALQSFTTEVWIARSDRTFRQAKFDIAKKDATSHQSFTVTFHSEQVAAQRQAITRPEGAKSFSTFIDELSDILADNANTAR